MFESIEHDTLPDGKRACIAITSWKKRIDTVGLTIYNLSQVCGPTFHIVLTLSTDEFPLQEAELPRSLVLMKNAGIFELMWIKTNIKSFKKWMPCALKYDKYPIISADDDCVYKYNYAKMLLDAYDKNPSCCYAFHIAKYKDIIFPHGPATLYKPNSIAEIGLKNLTYYLLDSNHDDAYYGWLLHRLGIGLIQIERTVPYVFHDTIEALSAGNRTMSTLKLVESLDIIYKNRTLIQ